MPKVAPAPFLVGWRSRIQYKHHFRRYYLKQWEFYSFAVQTNQTLADSSNEFVIMATTCVQVQQYSSCSEIRFKKLK